MWLDRLSAHSTPSASPPPLSSRLSNPSPSRRPNNLAPNSAAQRPGINPRSSSLSVISNDPSSLRRPTGSGLKNTSTVTDVPDPLRVLERLLVSYGPESSIPSRPGLEVNGTSVEEGKGLLGDEIGFEGLSLREFVSKEPLGPRLEQLPDEQTVEEYGRDKDKFEDLHRSIRACDDVLNSVELNLTSFQNDLAAVSAEIETLQARSTALTLRLDNRRIVENGLGPIVEEISLSPAIVKKIVDGPIDEAWVKALAEVEKRSKAIDSKSKEHRNIRGIFDLKPLLENLVNKALERIRDFLTAQIKALRSPNINAQIIQQQHFLRFKDLYSFLHKHHPKLAEEIAQAYINTMRWYFSNQFSRYAKALENVKLHVLDKHDVLGQDDGSRKLNILAGTKTPGPPHDAFNLGRRIDLLKTSNQTALSSFLAEEDKTPHYLEFPFRNLNLALIDNASAEYTFLNMFFSPALSFSTILRQFSYIFEPVFTLGQNLTKILVSETYDCLGLLLCVRLNQRSAFQLQRRKIPGVDGYINGTSMLLWPRFQVVMDQHCESVRTVASNLPIRKVSASERAKQSAAPHFMTQLFGQFIQGILALSTEAGDDEPVYTSLTRLRNEVEAFLTKSSKVIGESRKRERFLYNNYGLVLTIIGDMEGKLAAEQQKHFESLKTAFGEVA